MDLELLFQGNNLLRLLGGLWVSVRIALISMGCSIVLGTLFGLLMRSRSRIVRLLCQLYLEFIRIMPPLVLLFLVFFETTRAWNLNLSGELAAVIVFTLWGTAEMGDLVRGAVGAIPLHQYDSARAIGMTGAQLQRHVILPQTLRRLVPLTVNLTTRMIKTTSLVALIGVVEVIKVAQQIIDANRFDYPNAALWLYGAVFLLYFVVCYAISLFSRYLERKWAMQ
ncbi:amino acid ABC transporter permease [Gulosibacter sp. 10]|uniref:amino acid ABC transporter permease n=1 Tax=Gulosibacter sp. 10 TaxID=1255570 RepID=UPI00097E9BC9|nr:amino acid ABC transporter permease [Gulosibacter sp. 10]SJM70164.1 ABC-type amino acid transport system, permease component [Gulosibacter sp. 10]